MPIICRPYLPNLNEMIQPVIVVPILAPKIMLTACNKVITPAFTIPTTITVTTEDDCTNVVTNAPQKTPKTRLIEF